MQNALFQTHEPTAVRGRAEFYDLSLSQRDGAGRQITVVREAHGWWDNGAGRATVDGAQTQSATFTSYSEALDVFFRRRLVRIGSGFRHSFRWHPISGVPAFHIQVGVEAESSIQTAFEPAFELQGVSLCRQPLRQPFRQAARQPALSVASNPEVQLVVNPAKRFGPVSESITIGTNSSCSRCG
ncbi:MAG TPA: hypothetical protein VGG56_12885 [Terracidiphilus sp.]|jgi:hypothetical protein